MDQRPSDAMLSLRMYFACNQRHFGTQFPEVRMSLVETTDEFPARNVNVVIQSQRHT